MKKARYFIYFENCENSMGSQIELSKKQFSEQLKHLKEQVIRTAEKELPVEACETRVYDHPVSVETIYSFRCGCAITDLVRHECKDGYYFTTVKGRKK